MSALNGAIDWHSIIIGLNEIHEILHYAKFVRS